jgi:hypothetical protein
LADGEAADHQDIKVVFDDKNVPPERPNHPYGKAGLAFD